MGDDSSQIVRALISNVEYRFVEKLSSATDGSEVVLCEAPDGERRYATCEAWEAGYARFEARQSVLIRQMNITTKQTFPEICLQLIFIYCEYL